MRRLGWVGGMVLMWPALGAWAQDIDCENAMAQQEMNWCAEQDWVWEDERLNAAYQEAMGYMRMIDADLPADMRGAEDYLRQAQRSWIDFRDAACAAEGFPMRGGSAEPLLIYGCLARLTAQRADDLESLASGE